MNLLFANALKQNKFNPTATRVKLPMAEYKNNELIT